MNEEKKKYIPGIYNYCDRWCDKCAFTSRCLLFSNESKIAAFEILNDRLPEADEIADQFFDHDNDDENENNFDWQDDPDDELENDFLFSDSDEVDDEEEIDYDDEKEPPFLIEELAHQYFKQTHNLVENIDKNFNFSSTPGERIILPQLKNIYDNFEIISWYHSFIYIKIKRASLSKKEYLRYKDEDMKEFSKYDSDGTAKVAAISVKKSIKALSELHEYLPNFGSEIIMLSSLLQRVLSELEKEFPDHNKFKRPGLDD